MIHSPGDESAIGRIEYIELTDVGQAFKLGRYPLHFHMIGTVNQSYVRGNAIHQTYNRAVTLHGIHYFRVINNVAFNTMGHTIFVEDAVETRNYIHHNLIVQVKSSFSLLNTDWTPGGMWITHPNNIFVENVVAGSDAYGFWFDMQTTSVGPSYSPNICPEGETLGEFRDN
jgi:Right handed beta helix region